MPVPFQNVGKDNAEAVLRAALAERERRRTLATMRFRKYQTDPLGFIEKELLGHAWSKQREIAISVATNRRTAVKSCHASGKTDIASRIASWWLSVWPTGEAKCVTLAPTGDQVKGQLWAYINRHHEMGGLPGRVNQTEWLFGNEIVGVGRSPRDTNRTSIQGYHARRVLVLLDEATGIAKELWEGADTLLTGDDCHILAIGNPDDPNTEFGHVCRPGSGWNVIQVSAFDTPNFTGEVVPDYLKHLLVSKAWVEEKRKAWGETSPLYISKVLGDFPAESADSLIPLSALNAAKLIEYNGSTDPNELGVDVARFGDDATVIYHRLGNSAKRLDKVRNRDTMIVVGMVVRAVRATGARKIKVDDVGVGGGVVDRLCEMQRSGELEGLLAGVDIIGVNVGEAPTTEEEDKEKAQGVGSDATKEKFFNLRAQLGWQTRVKIVNKEVAILEDKPGDRDDLLSQAAQVKYWPTSKGEIQLEPKKDMKKRTKGESPDDWDAFVLALADVGGDDALDVMRKLGSM